MHERTVAARTAQAHWGERPIRERVAVIARLRSLIAREGAALAEAVATVRRRPMAEAITSEVLPLAAACSFLQRDAPGLLQPRYVGRRGRPVWLAGVVSEVRREPFGLVLIVGPANYPLFLPGVQALQALTAGNAVLLKPGRDSTAPAAALARLCEEAGLPAGLLQVLSESVEEVYGALRERVDLVVFTGSTDAGRKVITAAAEHLIPVIAELSGDDPFIVREDADVELAARLLRFGRDLNLGNSCIVPHRVIAVGAAAVEMRRRFPGLAIEAVANDAAALQYANSSSYALGATIVTRDHHAGARLADQSNAGVVVINDCIMPTADPRLPFGGRKGSGFGVTRGPEGLLALTRPKAIIHQRGARRHLVPLRAGDEQFFAAYLQSAHSGKWQARLAGLRELWRRAITRTSAS